MQSLNLPFPPIPTSKSDDTTMQNVKKEKPKKPVEDGFQVGNQFITYFYSTWITNPDILITDNIIKPYTKITHENITYEGNDFVIFLKSVASNGLEFSECKWDIIDSGSRQIYILVTGQISNTQSMGRFSQSFTITFAGNSQGNKKSWTLANSIFIIN